MAENICSICGEPIDCESIKFHNGKFCSLECWEEAREASGASALSFEPPKYLQEEHVYSRTCHDCGKPTDNYRCDECWAKIREDLGDDDLESTPVSDSYHDLCSLIGKGNKKGAKS